MIKPVSYRLQAIQSLLTDPAGQTKNKSCLVKNANSISPLILYCSGLVLCTVGQKVVGSNHTRLKWDSYALTGSYPELGVHERTHTNTHTTKL